MDDPPRATSSSRDRSCEGAPGYEITLLAFSSITIHGLAFREGEQVPVTLHRSVAYPARRFTRGSRNCSELEGWDSLPPPVGKPHLELQLDKRLGAGRIGFVYSARVVGVLDRPGGVPVSNPRLGLSTELVVKLVRPTNCRSLARETWFYERLTESEGYQGAVVPLCYGFFTVPMMSTQPPSLDPLEIKPWIDKNGRHVPLDFIKAQKEFGDHLPDDSDSYHDDERTCRTDSPWYEWQPNPENPLLSVLLLERLGETYSPEIYDQDQQSRNDIVDLIDGLSTATIMHHDFKFNNIVRSRSNVVCPRHGHAHEWRVIDFDRSEKWAKTMEGDDAFFFKFCRRQYIKKSFPAHFWYAVDG
ncbi:hypothetical protein Hypma_006381 [Hypsizygus marmoreus]|uniref:Protein kinase domain-containing protein n=1 Tax=Hypsizygus marmoreus TaxID=39966 RepID=A0A369K104_HYPMA|nr:hypothetical protein Hypma_006381 [Hypsizygus marmoreus]